MAAVKSQMLTLARGTAFIAAVTVASCSGSASSLVRNEYAWALRHGGCDCGPIAYPVGSAIPSFAGETTLSAYVQDRVVDCKSHQFIVAAAGDGGSELAGDMNLARARAAPIVRLLRVDAKFGRLDTLVFAGSHIAHPSTAAILCPTSSIPAQDAFK
jgi:hypothetical protein